MIHVLLTTQRNSVFEHLRAAGMNPADFEWADGIFFTKSKAILTKGNSIKNECPKLRHKKYPQFYFKFEAVDSEHCFTCSPGANHFEEDGWTDTWEYQLDAVSEWAIRLKKEIDAPDLWSDLNKYQIAISPDVTDDGLNEIISASEAEVIANKLEFLCGEINKVYNLTSGQDSFVRKNFMYLADLAKRSRSKDWALAAISIFQFIGWGLTLTPEQRQQLLDSIKTTFDGFMNLIG